MIFKRIAPAKGLEKWIECYWVIENDDPQPVRQKILPDGFPEIIFHYGDHYRICLQNTWEQQSRQLLAGQISTHFLLENTGRSGVLGIKTRPTMLHHFFQLDMQQYTDRVVDLEQAIGQGLQTLCPLTDEAVDHDRWIDQCNDKLLQLLQQLHIQGSPVDDAVDMILARNGMVAVSDIRENLGMGERQLERLFKKQVGLTPKYFARIIRFSTIFRLIEKGDSSWAGLAYESGYYDQAHFIRNFQAFTGEDPSRYGFDEKTMANFFLKKKS
ncbi:helix-turn-helix domain-containing protein [Paraflavitalea pollutisoli]|uniref:helix-turn-helix domain-containing protein n=1 Tax=Paraflavitalea pollutisoli TaxID=3034143 RepID=UPI0023EAEBC2|nr:helix-turn-helix domain-containing protein [Paraflavitalea sp. H1-2-19X]